MVFYNDIGLALGMVDGDPGCTLMRHLVSRNMPYNPWAQAGLRKSVQLLGFTPGFYINM